MKLSLKEMCKEVFTGYKEGLKKAQEYRWLQVITHHANQVGIPIMYMDLEESSARLMMKADDYYDIKYTAIELRPTLSTLLQIISIAHELGHLSQFHGECNGSFQEWVEYNEVNSILLLEQDAWLRSIRILHDIHFTDWDGLRRYAVKAYGSYALSLTDTYGADNFHFLSKLNTEILRVTKREVVYA
jgi:hypothetical protein